MDSYRNYKYNLASRPEDSLWFILFTDLDMACPNLIFFQGSQQDSYLCYPGFLSIVLILSGDSSGSVKLTFKW